MPGAEKISEIKSPFRHKWKAFYADLFSVDNIDSQMFQVSAAINSYFTPSRKNIIELGSKQKLLFERIEYDRDVEQGRSDADSHWQFTHELYFERFNKRFEPELLQEQEIIDFMRVYFLLRTIRAQRKIEPKRDGPNPNMPFTVESTFVSETDNSIIRPIQRIRLLELADDSDIGTPISTFIADFINTYKRDYELLTYTTFRALNNQGLFFRNSNAGIK